MHHLSSKRATWQSWIGLCATSFFLAEIGGVTMPFVINYLRKCGWTYDLIGLAASFAGLTSWLMTSPAGFLIDRTCKRRLLLASASLLVGFCFVLLPLAGDHRLWVFGLLGLTGLGMTFFGPITNALTLGMTGHARLNRSLGIKEGWNHAGNIAAALSAMFLVSRFPVTSVFYGIAVVSALAAASGFLIRPQELGHERAGPSSDADHTKQASVSFGELIRDRSVAILLGSATLFHLANAPVMPLVSQKITHVGGTESQVAAVVLVAQSVMIPVSLLAGFLGQRLGRKTILAFGFVVLPIRIALYAFTDDPGELIALQALDGIGAGIYGVTAVAVCGDLTHRRGHFNALVGVLGTAAGLGGVVGPLLSGMIVQHLGFSHAFFFFAGIAVLAAVLLLGWLPETNVHRHQLRSTSETGQVALEHESI